MNCLTSYRDCVFDRRVSKFVIVVLLRSQAIKLFGKVMS